jgi:predicted SAM-dependent methyltransferase
LINATGELSFLYRGLRALAGFRLAVIRALVCHGHFIRARAINRYIAGHSVRKLHLSATKTLPGFLNSQITGQVPIDITRPLPLADQTFDLIFSSHLIEHIHRKQCLSFLAEALRVLRPGGIQIIATPSAERIYRALYGDDDQARQILVDDSSRFYDDGFLTPCHYANLSMRAFGHRFLLDRGFLEAACQRIGYSKVEVVSIENIHDQALRDYLGSSKSPRWDMETEIFLLHKASEPCVE